ncbi:lamin-like protein [Benincasa hispida]|uniref:lamin-like protein n=1 Tax=Benincasa hispida TaxID=102211 RepID=UPI001900AE05|nr:lamin-like protein [Benincasa hispida]
MFGMAVEAVTTVVAMAVAGWLLFGAEGRQPVLHRVGGGKYTWTTNINFTDWSIHEHFYVGDWLYFGFDKHIYNVLEVNKTSYESCNDKGFIFNLTRGGRDVFNLTEAKTYYFLSGRGFCFQGMKVAVFVEESPPIVSPPNLPNLPNHSPSLQPLIFPFLPLAIHQYFYD